VVICQENFLPCMLQVFIFQKIGCYFIVQDIICCNEIQTFVVIRINSPPPRNNHELVYNSTPKLTRCALILSSHPHPYFEGCLPAYLFSKFKHVCYIYHPSYVRSHLSSINMSPVSQYNPQFFSSISLYIE
jgi:hypothetical protein